MPIFGTTPEKIDKWVAKGSVSKLLSSLKSDDALIRRKAAEGLAKIGNEEVLSYCRDNARSGDQTIRWHVTQILGLMGTPAAMKLLESVQDPSDAIAAKKKKQTESIN